MLAYTQRAKIETKAKMPTKARATATANSGVWPQPCQDREPERPRPALGRRHHLHRRELRFRLSGRRSRRLVSPGGRLCDQGSMPALPRAAELPEDIRDLVRYQKHEVAHERFNRDISDLVQGIAAVRKAMQPQRPPVMLGVPW